MRAEGGEEVGEEWSLGRHGRWMSDRAWGVVLCDVRSLTAARQESDSSLHKPILCVQRRPNPIDTVVLLSANCRIRYPVFVRWLESLVDDMQYTKQALLDDVYASFGFVCMHRIMNYINQPRALAVTDASNKLPGLSDNSLRKVGAEVRAFTANRVWGRRAQEPEGSLEERMEMLSSSTVASLRIDGCYFILHIRLLIRCREERCL